MGIGFIPFDKVTPSGLADTTVDPSYFYQVTNVPFGGTLAADGEPLPRPPTTARAYYRVKVDGVLRTDSWTDDNWNGTQYVAADDRAGQSSAGNPDYYPVHPVSELFLWMNPSLGDADEFHQPDATALHTIALEFTNGRAR